nr:Ku protein [uncultured Duganella sp.]
MAARALWKGAISFGLVHIPVELYSAVQEHELDLTMLDRRDFSPVGYKRYNKKTGKDVTWDDIVKGYEYEEDEYVVLSDEDLKRANVEATGTIDIQAFVDAADVPLTYYEQPYYLAPSKGGAKVYALLRETLRKAGKIAIATVVIRTKQHLCALVCIDDKIVLNTLRYAAEIRSAEELKLPPATAKAAGISDKELQMALSLVEGMSEEWKPEQYRDTYKDDVLALVKKKVKAGQTKTITAAEPEEKPAKASNVVDLVALLQDSLGKRPGKGGTKAAAKPAARKTASAKKTPTAAARAKSTAKPSPSRKAA